MIGLSILMVLRLVLIIGVRVGLIQSVVHFQPITRESIAVTYLPLESESTAGMVKLDLTDTLVSLTTYAPLGHEVPLDSLTLYDSLRMEPSCSEPNFEMDSSTMLN